MKTPITDAINSERYYHHSEGYSALLDAARRLELDRAALLEALSKLLIGLGPQKDDLILSAIIRSAASIIVAARANFPDED